MGKAPTLPLHLSAALVWAGLLLLPLVTPATLRAQGFSTFNGRNHPELNWQQADTPHFSIMYPAHLAGIEIEAAAIAEASYEALSANLDVDFDRKIRIYLSDEDEILNGFALSPLGYTNIWVHVNEVASTWSGNTKWLRTVLSHELVHLFHGEAVKSRLGLFAYFLGDPMPSFWAEGLAQYESELWDANRGDRWLRTAILDDRLSYEDGRSAWNGRLLYAVGNAQVRYFSEQYGDSTLVQLLKHRKTTPLRLFRHHDFYTAFEETTGDTYAAFYDDWRRHMNVYYNTLAGQMENTDSLHAEAVQLPGQYYYDIVRSPDTTKTAVLSLTSVSRPVRRLYVVDHATKQSRIVADGSIQAPVAWHPDGEHLVFARRTRARNGSILNDLFQTSSEGKKTRRLTWGRRASAPAYSPDGNLIAFIGSAGGTANVFLLDPAYGQETQLTRFSGDVQLASLDWHAATNRLVIGRFDANGDRDVLLLDPASRDLTSLPLGKNDEQFPIWSPDGTRLAVTSLEDRVPNVFIVDLETQTRKRVTNLVTGARAHDWLPADSTHPAGRIAITTSASKQRDEAYLIDAGRTPYEKDIELPAAYVTWTTHRPPHEIPGTFASNPDLVLDRSRYRSLKNLVHLLSFGLPFYNTADDWGLVGATSWTEPLGHHTFGATLSASFPQKLKNSFFVATYANNQLRPTVGLSGYTLLPTAVAYGNTYLVDGLSGGDATINWPLDIAVRPYTSTRLGVRFRYAAITSFNAEDFDDGAAGLALPEEGEKAEMRIELTRKTQRPYSGNVIHPLDGIGFRMRLTLSDRLFGGDTSHLRGDVAAYGILPAFGTQRLFVYGRAIYQRGTVFNQDRPGFARFDDIQITAPQFGTLAFSDSDRIRGFRKFVYGDRVVFGTLEYRMPFIPSLETTLLGLISLRATTLSGFLDAGAVWNGGQVLARRAGAGFELKNAVVIGGVLQLMHALGIAQPVPHIGTTDHYEVYYRVRATLPF